MPIIMANVLIKIKSLYESLPDTQRRLADYIVRHPEEVPFLSVYEVARCAGVSVATISRFARAIGYDAYKDFRTELGKESLAPADDFGGMYEGIRSSDSDETLMEKVFRGNITSLNDTLKVLDRKELLRAVEAIARAERLVLFGIGSSGYLAQDAALRFSHLDVPAEAYSDAYQIVSQPFRMKGNGSVAVGISHSGRSTMTVDALAAAKNNGVFTIGISNYLRSPLHEASRVFLCTSFPENQVKAAALSSRIAQLCVIDCLYLLVARHRKVSFPKIERLNAHVEGTLRISIK